MTHAEGNLSQLHLATDLLTSTLEAGENLEVPYVALPLVEPGKWPIVSEMPDFKTHSVKAEEINAPRNLLAKLALRTEGMKFEFRPPFYLNDPSQPQYSQASITIHKFLERDPKQPVDDILTIIKQSHDVYRLDRIINRDPYYRFEDGDDRFRILSYDCIQDEAAKTLLEVMSALTRQYVLRD